MRFKELDPYLEAELRVVYQHAAFAEKIVLLSEYKDGMPWQMAALACNDTDPRIRIWLARHVDLKSTFVDEDRSQSVFDKLSVDELPVVRASQWENRFQFELLDGGGDAKFLELSHLERLAFVRSRSAARSVILKAFDLSNSEFGLDPKSRLEVVRSFLSAPEACGPTYQDDHSGVFAFDAGLEDSFFDELWFLVSKWPVDSAFHSVRRLAGENLYFGSGKNCVLACEHKTVAFFILCRKSAVPNEILEFCRCHQSEDVRVRASDRERAKAAV